MWLAQMAAADIQPVKIENTLSAPLLLLLLPGTGSVRDATFSCWPPSPQQHTSGVQADNEMSDRNHNKNDYQNTRERDDSFLIYPKRLLIKSDCWRSRDKHCNPLRNGFQVQ